MPDLEELARLIESPTANGKLSLDDVRVLPLLRSAAVVKGLRFAKGARIFETMMERDRLSAIADRINSYCAMGERR
jgi:glutaredoxin 2